MTCCFQLLLSHTEASNTTGVNAQKPSVGSMDAHCLVGFANPGDPVSVTQPTTGLLKVVLHLSP